MSHPSLSPSSQSFLDDPAAAATPPKRKSGGNRMPRMLPDGSELVWPEELETALFEALALYPPVISRRGVTVYSDSGHPIELGHNIGRCQLIQEYIQKKTGKTRSRKQVASRLQRLRQTYKDDPHMMALLRSARKSPGEDVDRASKVAGVETESAHQSENKASPYRAGIPIRMGSLLAELNGSDEALDMSISLAPKSSDWDLSSNAANVENIAPNIPNASWAWPPVHLSSNSMSRRRLASNIPALRVQVDLPPPSSFLPQPPSASDTFTQATGLPSDHLHLCAGASQMSNPVTPLDQIFPAPEHPPELPRPARRPSNFSEQYSRNGSPAESVYAYNHYGGSPGPWSSVSSVQSFNGSTDSGGMGLYSGYRQQVPQIASNFSSPYSSPYPSPTMQTFPRSHARIKFEESLQQATVVDAQVRHIPQMVRNRSFQLPSRHSVTYGANHAVPNQSSYSHAPSPLSASHGIDLASACSSQSSSQSLEVVSSSQSIPSLPPSHSFDGQMSRVLGNLELASPVAIRPFFFNEMLDDSEPASPETLAVTETPTPAANTHAIEHSSGSLEEVKAGGEACTVEWPSPSEL
ncbi:TEA/ATTS domain family-domain-containing protein [Vararia minispora EC-137]|uniref:TEA/ATTS domain family-domain-containing protein n=1 Tax=Vararia minispora EC-137 TaxID=1314806 RepID=A0ACB8QW86_9AGAM|nr:TEA/ATTS domain family-domain-containing protein [Vararia minispora EC-137]